MIPFSSATEDRSLTLAIRRMRSGLDKPSENPGINQMITGVHHVQITVPKGAEQTAREFYCGLLGLSELEKPHALKPRGGFWLEVGDRQIHVGVEDGFDRNSTKGHVAYAVSDLEIWRNRLASAGIQVEDGIQIPGIRRFEFRDPFGNRIEMVEPV